MLGIGGIGMAGLAFLLDERGHTVSGSDVQQNRQIDWLCSKGISIQEDVPAGTEWIIRTTAVPDSHPDVRSASVPVDRRGEVLPELLRDRFTIAVSGTHGKTTTTSMVAQVLQCGYCIGGETAGFDGVARDGEIMAVEADESDGTVANYHPDIAVITNIEYDHMEHHANAEAFEDCFRALIANTKKTVFYCATDPVAARLCAGSPKAVAYSEVDRTLSVALPGRHNRLNAGAAAAVARALGRSDEEITRRLQTLQPIKRRFETVFQGDWTAISDYAHHPTEICALIKTARQELKPKRLLAVFQPHRYTRTKALKNDFPPAFSEVDHLWLTPVYAASEPPLDGGRSADLQAVFPPENRPELTESLEKAWMEIKTELRAGDVLLIIGAGDIEQMEQWVKNVAES